MRVIDTIWRLTKLGVFVGWGTALTVLAACSSAAVKPDSQRADARPPQIDTGANDRRAPDRAGLDTRRGEARAADQRRGWDIPLE